MAISILDKINLIWILLLIVLNLTPSVLIWLTYLMMKQLFEAQKWQKLLIITQVVSFFSSRNPARFYLLRYNANCFNVYGWNVLIINVTDRTKEISINYCCYIPFESTQLQPRFLTNFTPIITFTDVKVTCTQTISGETH